MRKRSAACSAAEPSPRAFSSKKAQDGGFTLRGAKARRLRPDLGKPRLGLFLASEFRFRKRIGPAVRRKRGAVQGPSVEPSRARDLTGSEAYASGLFALRRDFFPLFSVASRFACSMLFIA